jgi:hypothetical protein
VKTNSPRLPLKRSKSLPTKARRLLTFIEQFTVTGGYQEPDHAL